MILDDEATTVAAGAALARQLRAGDVVTMTGDLGAGKTTFVRGLLQALGHEGEVPSPSFAIVQPYEDLDPPVWHADLKGIPVVHAVCALDHLHPAGSTPFGAERLASGPVRRGCESASPRSR